MHVLFLCPHGAAKSVIATAMVRAVAQRDGIDLTASTAGTDPDDALNPIAVGALHARGLDYSAAPRLVNERDVQTADLVVSFGCKPGELPAAPKRWLDWSAAPDASDDVDALCAFIEAHLGDLSD